MGQQKVFMFIIITSCILLMCSRTFGRCQNIEYFDELKFMKCTKKRKTFIGINKLLRKVTSLKLRQNMTKIQALYLRWKAFAGTSAVIRRHHFTFHLSRQPAFVKRTFITWPHVAFHVRICYISCSSLFLLYFRNNVYLAGGKPPEFLS